MGLALRDIAVSLLSAPSALPASAGWFAALLGAPILAWLAPPLAGSFLAGLGLVAARRDEREQAPTAAALGWAGLAASLTVLAAARATAQGWPLPWPDSPLPWPDALSVPGAFAGLVLASAVGWMLASRGHGPLLAALSGPGAAAALSSGAGLHRGGVFVAGAALVAAGTSAAWKRHVDRSLQHALLAWRIIGGLAVVSGIAIAAAGGRARALPAAMGLALLSCAAVSACAGASRRHDLRSQRLARGLCAAAIATLAAALIMTGRALGLGPIAVALAPLAAVAAGLVAVRQDRRAMLRIETPWLVRDARLAMGLFLVAAAAASTALPARLLAWPVSLGLAALAAGAALERALGAARLAAALATLGAVLSGAAAAAGLGLPLAWIAPVTAAALGAAGVIAPRLPGRLTRATWAPVALAGLGACLVASLATCAFGLVVEGLVGAALAALAPLALAGREGLVDLGHSLLAGRLPEGRRESAVAALQLGVLAFLPLAPLVALGAWTWAAPVLATEALLATALSRWRPTLLHPAAWLVVGSLALLPLLAHPGGWLPGGIALALLACCGALELTLARSLARGTHRMAAELLAAAGFGAIAWAGAGWSVAPIVLLGAAVAAQVLDALISDALVAQALRRASCIAWIAASLAGLARAAVDPLQGAVLLAGAALTGGLLVLLRHERWPLLGSGLCLAAAVSAALVSTGLPILAHPTLHAAAWAGVLIGWGTLESRDAARTSPWLALGLAVLAGALSVESHLPGAPDALRAVAALGGLGMVAAGVLARHRAPLQAGILMLALEGLWLLGESAAWAVDHPLPAAAIVGALMAAVAGLLWRLAWRAGGRTALWMAWSTDVARARESWARWR